MNVIEVVQKCARHVDGLKRVALFGTPLRRRIRHVRRGSPGVAIARPRSDEIAFIHDTYSQLARTGAAAPGARERLIELANTLAVRDGAEAIVLAGTDLSLIFDDSNTPFPHLDCASAHIQAIMQAV